MKTLYKAFVLACLMPLVSTAEDWPKDLGYRFPDEWEDHQGTMMTFPARHSYGRDTRALRREFANLAKAIAANEPVVVFCLEKEASECRRALGSTKNITIRPGNYRIDWARDTAPMVIRDRKGKLASAGFRFNGWGKKYEGWQEDIYNRDDISRAMGWPIFHSDLVLEGGAIEIGGGIGIVTESCVINPNRTNWTKSEVESELKAMLGLDRVIWIKSGLMPDDTTDGHVDGLLKFIDDETVLLHTCDDDSDVNYEICKDARRVLREHGLEVIDLPLMDDLVHMNFYIGSGGDTIYAPICGDPEQDEPALKVLRKLFKEVVPIKAVAFGEAGGGIHCQTQQIPVAKP